MLVVMQGGILSGAKLKYSTLRVDALSPELQKFIASIYAREAQKSLEQVLPLASLDAKSLLI